MKMSGIYPFFIVEPTTEFDKYRSVGIDRIYGAITIGAGIEKIKSYATLIEAITWASWSLDFTKNYTLELEKSNLMWVQF